METTRKANDYKANTAIADTATYRSDVESIINNIEDEDRRSNGCC